MKIIFVDAHNNTAIDSKDLMKIFKERQLAVKISNRCEYDTFIEMAKEAGFNIPEGLCFEDIKKRPCLHLSQVFENKLFCDFVEYCEAPEPHSFCFDMKPYKVVCFDMKPYKVVSYDEFIRMGCEQERVFVTGARGNGKSMRILKMFLDELGKEEKKVEPLSVKKPSLDFGKSIRQHLVGSATNQPYDIHISSDGKTTTAKFYVNGQVVREAEAKCHPEDRFNFHTGAELAFDRLFEKKPKEKKAAKFKPGDKIRVKRDLEAKVPYGNIRANHFMADMRGNVVTVASIESYEYVTSGIIIRIEEDQSRWCWTPEMFELV